MEADLRKNVIGIVWVAGLLLAAVIYRLGPDRILGELVGWIDAVRAAISGIFAALALNTFDILRALALGLLPVFIALCMLAHRRGHRVVRAAVIVAVLFLVLLYQPAQAGWEVSSIRWTLAFITIASGSLIMTRRLLEPPRRPTPWSDPGAYPPYQPPPPQR